MQRAPFRVGYLPAGYRYRGAQSQTDKDGAPGMITLVHTKADSATICVSLYRYDQHSWNWDSQAKSVEVNGLPARVTDGMVMIRYGSALITVFAKQREGSGELLAVARGLSLAKDPADESTWFAIARAVG